MAATSSKLNPESIRGWLRNRKGWKRRANRLQKTFEFRSFRDSIVFVNRVATIADTHDHRPEIDVREGEVTLTLQTQRAGGITETDLKVAEQLDFATSNSTGSTGR